MARIRDRGGVYLLFRPWHSARRGFLFPFTNFHPASKCTTSLPNSQLDQMLRSRARSVAIRVIDACQAGTEYIKGSSEMNEAMNTSKDSFKSLYFFTLPRIFKSHMSTSLLAILPRALQNRCSCMWEVKFGTMTSLAILGTILDWPNSALYYSVIGDRVVQCYN